MLVSRIYIFVLLAFSIFIFKSSALAQENDNLSFVEMGTPELILSLESGAEEGESDLYFKPIIVPSAPMNSIHIAKDSGLDENFENISSNIIAELQLDFTFDDLNWLTVFPNSMRRSLENGFALSGRIDDGFLFINQYYDPLAEVTESENQFGLEKLAIDNFTELDSNAVSFSDQFSVPMTGQSSNKMASVSKPELWQNHPEKLVALLLHMQMKAVLIDIPSNLNGSYPQNPIELNRFITLARENDIEVWARIYENFQTLSNGNWASATEIKELNIYNEHSPIEARLAGAQFYLPWSKMETYIFYKNQWLKQAIDLYVSIAAENKNLGLDIILPEQALDKLNDEAFFGKLRQVGDSLSIILQSEKKDEVENIIRSFDSWVEENQMQYNLALARPDGNYLAGNFMPNENGKLRLVQLGNWFVLMQLKHGNSEIGSGYEYNLNINSTEPASRKNHAKELIDFANDIWRWQANKTEFNSLVLYGLPEFQ